MNIPPIALFVLCLLTPPMARATATLVTGTSEGMRYRVERVATEFASPWGLAFIGRQQLLVTERVGRISLVDTVSGAVTRIDLPVRVRNQGQGGLLDVAVPPGYTAGGWLYFTYSKPEGRTAATALGRARLTEGRLVQWSDLLVTRSASTGDQHYGSRIAFDGRGHLFFSVGDRGNRANGQDLSTHAGKILRLRMDGSVPDDNPFVQGGGLAEIWSFGHRNPQGLAFDPVRKRLWSNEHGERGGDEINRIEGEGNYGWPVVSHSMEYWGPFPVGEATQRKGMIDPVKVFTPAIAPGSLLVYGGTAFPQWRGDLFSAAMVRRHLNRVALNEAGEPVGEERMLFELNERIRALAESPEGWIYLAADSGTVYRLRPLDTGH